MSQDLDHYEECKKRYEDIFSKQLSDSTFILKQDNDTVSVPFVRIIIANSSPVFYAMLKGNMKESFVKEVEINDPQIKPQCFLLFIRYIYCGTITLTEENVLNINYLAKIYMFKKLQEDCRKYIVTNLLNYSKAIDILLNETDPDIVQLVRDVIIADPIKCLNVSGLPKLSREDLISIISDESLYVQNEVELFKIVETWIRANNPTGDNNDILKWIKFPFIISKDLITIVKPTGFISMDIYMASLEFNSSPESVKIDEYYMTPRISNIRMSYQFNGLRLSVEEELFLNSLFSNYKLNLLYKASKDGFHCNKFHELCDRKGPTVVIAYTSSIGIGKIIGGYTPLNWEKSDHDFNYVNDDRATSFLFSITLQRKFPLKDTCLSLAICNSSNHGPKFGGGHDLEIVSDCNINYNNYYNFGHTYDAGGVSSVQFFGANSYQVTDYLVYQAIQW